MAAIIVLVVFAVGIPIVLLSVFLPMRRNEKITGGIVNCDTFSRKFVFRTDMSRAQVFEALNTRNVGDRLFCSFDPASGVISLSDYTRSSRYNVRVDEYKACTIVRLQDVGFKLGSALMPYKINEFILMKLEAEPALFDLYKF